VEVARVRSRKEKSRGEEERAEAPKAESGGAPVRAKKAAYCNRCGIDFPRPQAEWNCADLNACHERLEIGQRPGLARSRLRKLWSVCIACELLGYYRSAIALRAGVHGAQVVAGQFLSRHGFDPHAALAGFEMWLAALDPDAPSRFAGTLYCLRLAAIDARVRAGDIALDEARCLERGLSEALSEALSEGA